MVIVPNANATDAIRRHQTLIADLDSVVQRLTVESILLVKILYSKTFIYNKITE